MDDPDCYEILGVPRDASMDVIRDTYLRLAKQVHPDQGGSGAIFRQVRGAFETLSDPASRAAYDRELGLNAEPKVTPPPPPPPPQEQRETASNRVPFAARNPSLCLFGIGLVIVAATARFHAPARPILILGLAIAVIGLIGLLGRRRAAERYLSRSMPPHTGVPLLGDQIWAGLPIALAVVFFVFILLFLLVLSFGAGENSKGGNRRA